MNGTRGSGVESRSSSPDVWALLFALLLAIVLPLGFLGYSAQEKRAAAQQTRMEALYLDGKGLSVNLTSVAIAGFSP